MLFVSKRTETACLITDTEVINNSYVKWGVFRPSVGLPLASTSLGYMQHLNCQYIQCQIGCSLLHAFWHSLGSCHMEGTHSGGMNEITN